MENLACAYADAGRWQEAVELCEKALQIEKDTLGLEHPSTLSR